MRLVRQPTRETCGQAVVAMLLEMDVATACRIVGTSGRTHVTDLKRALEAYGLTLRRMRQVSDGLLEHVVRIGDGKESHFVAVKNSVVYDPSAAGLYGWSELDGRLRRGGWRVLSVWGVETLRDVRVP